MKKYLYVCFILAVLFTIVSCGDAKQTTSDADTKDNDEQKLDNNNWIGDKRLESYEEYLNFLQSTELPDNFVKYEMLSQFGEFKTLICSLPPRGYDCYKYFIVDKYTGIDLLVYIDHEKELMLDSNGEKIISAVNGNDMRTVSETDGISVFWQSGIEYAYKEGNLISVSWVSDEIRYTIFGELQNCKVDTSSALSKLFKLDTAAEAVASVKEPSEAIK